MQSESQPDEATSAEATEEAAGRRYLNRHLSWLEWDRRVLALAEGDHLPLLERVKFVAIFSTNLDEFFQVRVAELDEQWDAGITALSPDGLTPEEQLLRIRERVRQFTGLTQGLFRDDIRPALGRNGIEILDWDQLDEDSQKRLSEQFEELVLPVLTPLAVDPAHPFPYISNLSLNVGVVVRDTITRRRRFARVKVPQFLPRFLKVNDNGTLIPVEQVIAAHLPSLFPGMEIVEHHAFRVTRNQDPDIGEDEIEDLRRAVERLVQERRRSHHAVRLEIEKGTTEDLRQLLIRELDLEPWDVEEVDGLIDLGALMALYDLPRPDLKVEEWEPVVPRRLAEPDSDIFAAIREGDILLQHPYDSFSATVGAFLAAAAGDPYVQAIKQTLYRTSGTDSGIVASLIRAAQEGKQVVALVELTARFDEERNVTWAEELEKAGVHVVYGVVGLKTHAKVSLVVRHEPDGLVRYSHVGTGNYNSTTARLYEDLGILTADERITEDVADLFNYLTGYSAKRSYHRLLVAPYTLRSGLEELIAGQARPGGRIVMKTNGLVDTALIDSLYDASRAGADIDLIIRGACCLIPDVAGLSEHIRVRSVVGRYLEHSRIYRFGDGEDASYYIGSGDLMPRNLDRRVEALVPIDAAEPQADVGKILGVYLSNRIKRWELDVSGEWHLVSPAGGGDPQQLLWEQARERGESSVGQGS